MEKAAAIVALVYTVVSFINISVPIIQPYLIMLVAWCANQKNKDKEDDIH